MPFRILVFTFFFFLLIYIDVGYVCMCGTIAINIKTIHDCKMKKFKLGLLQSMKCWEINDEAKLDGSNLCFIYYNYEFKIFVQIELNTIF